MQIHKTNAMRILDTKHISYQIHSYDPEDGRIHGTAVAEKINRPEERVYKTLAAHNKQNIYIFVIPVSGELDLKKAAKAAGEKKIEMLPVKELQKWTGYIRGGCSPIGMKKLYPTYVDQQAAAIDSIIVSAGKIGVQVELEPQDLLDTVQAKFADLIQL
ncbi:Cys-tRNA(Pro) deacylase [Paenibacillus sp. CAA11]|uniref:Cys-tRNA(Pro) deacylase n=1 Tax=Paenibacillus sp. CAA11 TaxID=1532905 RepID=UPI000D3848C4|nr:Cys-tRNA(Pro) deacylase [Paenibacillus sp. CAA11]AWB44559.1 Cys-tRNA(Pro) deacylase [Paenibacillus sp. CAA11]